jgi:predicted pyridoxine 5'-phosphate oxidase superfamily flavin-nucleotide-binding protein
MNHYRSLAFTPSVKAVQTRMGSRGAYERQAGDPEPYPGLGPDEREFVEARDSFYWANVGEDGWPYVQHRGGPPGFLRVLDPHTLGFADLRGNRQYVSVGNLERDDRAALILVDYPNRARLKLFARAVFVSREQDPLTLAKLVPAGLESRVERGILLRLAGHDWNCSQHITPRYTETELAALLGG